MEITIGAQNEKTKPDISWYHFTIHLTRSIIRYKHHQQGIRMENHRLSLSFTRGINTGSGHRTGAVG